MCEICDSLCMPNFCTSNDVLDFVYQNYGCNDILPALINVYRYLRSVIPNSIKIVDVMSIAVVDSFPTIIGKKKKCSKCGKIKPATLEYYGYNPNTRYKLTSSCLECKHLYDKNRHLKINYDKTLNEVLQMLRDQNHECASCEDPIDIHTKRVHHIQEIVLDLLCNRCNLIVGHAKHDVNIMIKVLFYQAKKSHITYRELMKRMEEFKY